MNEAVAPVAQAVATRRPNGLWKRSTKSAARRGPAPLRHKGIGVALETGEPRLHHRNQGRHRGERELKADAENRLRFDRDDGQDREGEVAHSERPPVHDHRAEHDQRHHERALGANARAGGDIVKQRARHRDAGRPFLDRVFERERRRQREQAARYDEEDSGDERHLHAGYCDDVEYSGLADEVLGVVGEEVALSRHHGRGDRALVAADDRVDPLGEAIARLIDRQR